MNGRNIYEHIKSIDRPTEERSRTVSGTCQEGLNVLDTKDPDDMTLEELRKVIAYLREFLAENEMQATLAQAALDAEHTLNFDSDNSLGRKQELEKSNRTRAEVQLRSRAQKNQKLTLSRMEAENGNCQHRSIEQAGVYNKEDAAGILNRVQTKAFNCQSPYSRREKMITDNLGSFGRR